MGSGTGELVSSSLFALIVKSSEKQNVPVDPNEVKGISCKINRRRCRLNDFFVLFKYDTDLKCSATPTL